ncbi:hypothetical protein Bca4012_009686 [Brassica carinata]
MYLNFRNPATATAKLSPYAIYLSPIERSGGVPVMEHCGSYNRVDQGRRSNDMLSSYYLFFISGVPGAYVIWYRPLYLAMR